MKRSELRRLLQEAGYPLSSSTLAKYLQIFREETGRTEPLNLDDNVATTMIAACQYLRDNAHLGRSLRFRRALLAVLHTVDGTADAPQAQSRSETLFQLEGRFDELRKLIVDATTEQAALRAELREEQQRNSQTVATLSTQFSALQAQVASLATDGNLTSRYKAVEDMLQQYVTWLQEWRRENTAHLKDHAVWMRRNVERLQAIHQAPPLMNTDEIQELLHGARQAALLAYGFDLLEHPGGYVLIPRTDEDVPAPVSAVPVNEPEPEPEPPVSLWSRITGRLRPQE